MDRFRRRILFLLAAASVGGCAVNQAPATATMKAIEQPSAADVAWLDALAPKAIAWMAEQEAALLKQGRPLTAEEIEIARRMGVQTPEKIRLLVLAEFPFPSDPLLAKEARAIGFGSGKEGGRSMGYAVLVKPQFRGARWLLAHECVHIAQRERLGLEGFIRRYLLEMRTAGYEHSPLEAEANRLMQAAQ